MNWREKRCALPCRRTGRIADQVADPDEGQIDGRAISFGPRRRATFVPFRPVSPQVPLPCYLLSCRKFPDNRNRESTCVSLQPSRFAAYSPARPTPASNLGEGRAGYLERRLFLFRSGSGQEGARPVRAKSSSCRHPPVSRSHAETGSRHGESAARGGRLPERASRRFSASGTVG